MLMKNCDPPLLGRPVLAMDKVPGKFDVLSMSSSGILPPASRSMVFPSQQGHHAVAHPHTHTPMALSDRSHVLYTLTD